MYKKVMRKKIIVLGTFAVGKTSLVNRFTINEFSDNYVPTIGVNIKNKKIDTKDQIINLLVWDIADMVTYDNIPSSYLNGTQGIMLVFDLSRPDTLERIINDYKGFLNTNPDIATIIIGNKVDLMKKAKLKEFEEKLKDVKYFFTSAKEDTNVDKAFEYFV